jgi:hypothetical protein
MFLFFFRAPGNFQEISEHVFVMHQDFNTTIKNHQT